MSGEKQTTTHPVVGASAASAGSLIDFDAVRKAMRDKGWDQKKLAKHAKVAQPSITRFFRNKASRKIADKIFAALEIEDPASMLGESAIQELLDLAVKVRARDPEKLAMMSKWMRLWLQEAEAHEELRKSFLGSSANRQSE